MNENLGYAGVSDLSDPGNISLLGLDEFGQPYGMGAGWGATIGVGASTMTAIGVRAFAKTAPWQKWAEGIGAGVGALAGGTMMIFKKTRHAGLAALASAVIGNGLRQVETLLAPAAAAPTADAITAATAAGALQQLKKDQAALTAAGVTTPTLSGAFGMTGLFQTRRVGERNHALGMTVMEPTKALADGMPKLLSGNPDQHRRNTATLLGVPGLNHPLSQIASAYGTTAMGGGR
jgi:hypothetical protein